PRYFGSNRLELKRDGEMLAPLPGVGGKNGVSGEIAGSIAPPTAPQNRLPLHLAFAIDRPGRYSVRWTVIGMDFGPVTPPVGGEFVRAESGWLDFDVVAAGRAAHEI